MAASLWDFKLSLSHTERGSDAEQAGGLAHDLNLISSIDIFLVLALAVLWKCQTKSQAVLKICANVYNVNLTHFYPQICFSTELLNREPWRRSNLSFGAKLHITRLFFSTTQQH